MGRARADTAVTGREQPGPGSLRRGLARRQIGGERAPGTRQRSRRSRPVSSATPSGPSSRRKRPRGAPAAPNPVRAPIQRGTGWGVAGSHGPTGRPPDRRGSRGGARRFPAGGAAPPAGGDRGAARAAGPAGLCALAAARRTRCDATSSTRGARQGCGGPSCCASMAPHQDTRRRSRNATRCTTSPRCGRRDCSAWTGR